MANSHSRLICVNTCDHSESSITNTGLGLLPAIFRPRGVLLALWSRSAGQRPVCPLLGVCPRSLAVLILSPVARLVIWPGDLHHFPLTYSGNSPSPSPSLSTAPQDIIFPRHLISCAQWKIAPDICDYSKPLNCLFLLHLLSCDRLSFIFTATWHLFFSLHSIVYVCVCPEKNLS